MRYMSGGQFTIDMVFRGPNGHAHWRPILNTTKPCSPISWLKVVTCATPYDGKGLLKAAIRDPNPIIFPESEMMYGMKGEVPEEEYIILGKGDIKKPGSDVTLIAWGRASLL